MHDDGHRRLDRPVLWVADKSEILAEPNGAIAIEDAKNAILWRALELTAKEAELSPEQIREITNLPPNHPAILVIEHLLSKFVPGSQLEVMLTKTQQRNRDLARYILDGIEKGRWTSERAAAEGENRLLYTERVKLGFKQKTPSAIRAALNAGKKLL